MAKRHSLMESGQDPVEALSGLEKDNQRLVGEVDRLKQQIISVKESETIGIKEQRFLETELAKAKEKVALVEVALQHSDGVVVPEGILSEMQDIWGKLGVPIKERSQIRLQIENCLEDTCKRKLEESSEQLAATEATISDLESRIQAMKQSLDDELPSEATYGSSTLLERLEALHMQCKQVEPRFVSAVAKRDRLAEHVNSLSAALGKSHEALSLDLQSLLQDVNSDEEPMKSHCNLSDDFLSRCETQVSSLRLEKSKVLASNSNMQKEALKLVSEMNLTEREILPIIVHSIKQRRSTIPSWWQEETASAAVRSISSAGGLVRSTAVFAQHLSASYESLQSVSKGRRELSTKLSGLVKRAQTTLLEIVDGELNATEAYSSFHDALFRLPPLSKEHIHACIEEIDALTAGVEAMTQSEIEALTVVWAALNISSGTRGGFWGEIEESLRAVESKPEGPFHDAVQACSLDSEEWMLVVIKEATKTYQNLESSLFKLEKIHEEVERQSARQDAKSRIISLDSEIRILSAKLSEFEDEKCGKERLVTKKTTSSNLLREERFRKQMQSKFVSKFEQLAALLKAWRNDEGDMLDPNLLSDEVRLLLANSDGMDTWVEKRTEFMHLRTVRSKGPSKRGAESVPDREEEQPSKRLAPSSTLRGRAREIHEANSARKKQQSSVMSTSKKNRISTWTSRKNPPASSTVAASVDSKNKRKLEDKISSSVKSLKTLRMTRQTSSSLSKQAPIAKKSRPPLSPTPSPQQNVKQDSRPLKKLTLPPFGHVLEQALTPTRKKDKENE
jgi:hypothetical protein